MAENNTTLFRQKTIDKLSNPDELTDYLKVTNPGVWAILTAVVLLLVGVLVWACVGTLTTRAAASVIAKDGAATVSVSDKYTLEAGMKVTIAGEDFAITSTETDELGRTVGIVADTGGLTDGSYAGTVIVDETHAIDFLLQSS